MPALPSCFQTGICMVHFSVEFAGVPIGVSAREEKLMVFLADYLTDREPQFSVCATDEELEEEKNLQKSVNEKYGERLFNLSTLGLEGQVVFRKIAEGLVDFGVLLMHGSAIAVDGKAYIFIAPSGTGKSTHTTLWREYLGDRAVMINDDKPFIKISDGNVTVYSNPWNGKHRRGENISAPLCGIAFLSRAAENTIERAEVSRYIPFLMRQSFRSENGETMAKIIALLDSLGKNVPFWDLRCNMEPEAAEVAFAAMSGGIENEA